MSDTNTVEALNIAFQADPGAINALLINRVPCNQFLADDQFVQVEVCHTLPAGCFAVGALGLVNAVLAANGLPLVAAKFSDKADEDGRHKLLGFCEYIRPEASVNQAAE